MPSLSEYIKKDFSHSKPFNRQKSPTLHNRNNQICELKDKRFKLKKRIIILLNLELRDGFQGRTLAIVFKPLNFLLPLNFILDIESKRLKFYLG